MEEDSVKKAMGRRLVSAMEPETAKLVLMTVIDGDDLYEAILKEYHQPELDPPLPKRRYRRAKKAVNSVLEPA